VSQTETRVISSPPAFRRRRTSSSSWNRFKKGGRYIQEEPLHQQLKAAPFWLGDTIYAQPKGEIQYKE
jgi:hypothetical protein